ncbi:hypothetical protein MSP8887_02196 [Marinomonas spartinae]|uniref:hypothetical protein n=1 Tax=Marinomonas spartinae TaxID=1792290 RepID=UPI000808A673|nr:hypothetical protein [Marinomonas spartinae]SBS34636.1 hypothetical protein MSP8887_02196 [Marinomonas spartinae]
MMLDGKTLDSLLIYFSAPGAVGIIIWFVMVLYLKHKWVPKLEDILDSGVRFYSLNMVLAGQGVLQYATVFSSRFYAKRFGMLEKRDCVPRHIQRWFIVAMWLLLISTTLFIGSGIVIYIYT